MDLGPYREELDQFDMTEEEKEELLIAVKLISATFVDRALGLNRPPRWKDEAYREKLENDEKKE